MARGVKTDNKKIAEIITSYALTNSYNKTAKECKVSANTVKNIITYQIKNTTIEGGGKGRQTIDNIGSGTGYYITDGYAVPITWTKPSRKSQTIYKYTNGEEIKFNDGNTFIQIQHTNQELTIN